MMKNDLVNKNKLRRIRIIYGFVASVLLLCMGLFFFDVITAEDTEQLENIANNKYGEHDFTLGITDLHSGNDLYENMIEIPTNREDVKICARVHRYDIEVYADMDKFEKWSETRWALILQLLCTLLLGTVVVLTIIVLVSFYRNLKQGKVFPSKNITLIRWIGVLMILMSLIADVSTFIERKLALDFLVGTSWEPDVKLSIHFTRILFGLVVVFLAEIFYIGYEMQEEQELTI